MRSQFLRTKLILQVLVLLTTLLLLPFATSQNHNPPIAKPGCVDTCGDIPIPYPFGTTEKCYHNNYFMVTCNHNDTNNPPKLFWERTDIEIKKISLRGQMTVMQYVSRNCYNADDDTLDRNNPYIQMVTSFTVNNTANKFTVVGCDAYGYVYGKRDDRRYSTGCIASCNSEGDLEEGSCMGSGCCQTAIPENVLQVNVTVSSFHNYTNVSDISNCTYGFLVEDSTFRFSPKNLTNLKDVKKLPMALDWAIANGTCEEALKNSSEYACKSANSHCHRPDYGYGYRCYCNDGYDGNPYFKDGCKDIDECSPDRVRQSCEYDDCVNVPGSFRCLCPKGYHGNATKGGKGCSPEESLTQKLTTGISLGVLLLLLIACLAYILHNRRQSKRVKRKCFIQNGGELLLNKLLKKEASQEMLSIFTSVEMKNATKDFNKDNIVGQGGFGTVYKGLLSDNRMVAIKKSKIVDPTQIDQFVNEVILLSRVSHPNAVKLLGCCLETEVPILVYEFISNGTLFTRLHDPNRARLLDWPQRLRIAAETASALSYLHSEPSNPIIHRDVKSDNILLDNTFTAKVADFGASRLIPLDQTQISTIVQGTTGYLDPEYLLTHQLTAKSDVYSFGVVLLELLTRRRAVKFDGPEQERSLVGYSMLMSKQDNFASLIDHYIAGQRNQEQVMEVARLAKWCVKMKGDDRPSMQVVAEVLESLRLGRRRSLLVQAEQNDEEVQLLPVEGFDGIVTNGNGSSMGAGPDSFADQLPPPMSGGR